MIVVEVKREKGESEMSMISTFTCLFNKWVLSAYRMFIDVTGL